MARCEPLVDAVFVQTVTGVEIADLQRVDELISVTSDLVAEELIGPNACINPQTVQMRLKLIVAQYVAYLLTTKSTDQTLKAETVGDYRVEYQTNVNSGFDLVKLRQMLSPLRIRAYTVHTIDDLTNGDPLVYGAVPHGGRK